MINITCLTRLDSTPLSTEEILPHIVTKHTYIGCFAENKMPMKPENGYMIVNNESDPSKMGHWILIYKNNDKHYFFDSFGFHPSIYVGNIASYCNTYNNIQLLLKKVIQSSQSHMMGPVNFLVSKNDIFVHGTVSETSIYMYKLKFSIN